MEFLKEVSTKAFNPNVIPIGTCIRLHEHTLKNDTCYDGIVYGYSCDHTTLYVATTHTDDPEFEPYEDHVYCVQIHSRAVESGMITIEQLVTVSDIKLEDYYSNTVHKVRNPITVRQFKDRVNSIPEYLDGLNLIISKKSVDGTKLIHHYTEATDCIYYEDEDEKRLYGGLLLELC